MTAASLLCLLAVALVPPQNNSQEIEAIMSGLEEASAQLRSFSASFRQEEVDEFGDRTTFNGNIRYLAPDKWRMISELNGRPVEEVVSDGERGWMVRHSLRRIEVVSLSSINRRSGGISFTGAARMLGENYLITLAGTEELPTGAAYRLHCLPIEGAPNADPSISSLELWINVEQPAPVIKMLLRQRDGVVITWELQEVRRNVEVDPRQFEFHRPRGYEVIQHE